MKLSLLAWGANQYGQLALEGWSVMEQCETPQTCSLDGLPEDILTKVYQICGGGGHTLLLDTDGSVWACGQNNRGQCAVSVSEENKIVRPWNKIDFGANKIAEVAAGWEHSVARDTNGIIFAWGSNSHGQIGNTVERGRWSDKPLKLVDGAQSLSAGLRQTSWISKGSIGCCGHLGHIKKDVPDVLKPLKIVSGQKHNFVLMGNSESDYFSGRVFCWGENKFWQLATNPEQVKVSEQIILADGLKNEDFVDIASGWSHGAAITTAGKIVCWGRGNYGQLGCPSNSAHQWNWPSFDNSIKARKIALGSEHTVALAENGDVWTCGWNEHGNCGNGNLEDQFEPCLILKKATLIGCGASHSFAVVES